MNNKYYPPPRVSWQDWQPETPIWQQVNQEFECVHEVTEVRTRNQVNGRAFWKQCMNCGRLLHQVGKNSPEVMRLAAAEPVDDSIAEAYGARRREREAELRQELADRQTEAQQARQEEWDAWYNWYLNTPEWKDKRRKVFERANNICEGCRNRKAVEVHHLTYERVGHEMLFDLVAVCALCHREIHATRE